jgi:polysaccharide pyruvyl transferase WcaK-like protein
MIRVLIASAAYGGHNIGDDAILEAMVEQLKGLEESGISVAITAVTRQPAEMAKRLGIRTLEFDGLGPRARTGEAW